MLQVRKGAPIFLDLHPNIASSRIYSNSILFLFYAIMKNITNNKYHKNSSYVLSLYTFMTPRSIIHMVQLMLLKKERNAECDNETVVVNIYFRFRTLVFLCYLCCFMKKVLNIIYNEYDKVLYPFR